MRFALSATLVALVALSTTAAQADVGTPTKMGEMVLGSIVSAKGDALTVKTKDGAEATVKLAADTKIMKYEKASLSDVAAGEFIGTAAVEGPDGKLHAQEIHILAPELRGLGEGHTNMGDPKTTMTNGNIDEYAAVKDGKKLKVTYKGGAKDIEVGPNVPGTRLLVSSATHLKPGANIRLFFHEAPDHALVANMVTLLAE